MVADTTTPKKEKQKKSGKLSYMDQREYDQIEEKIMEGEEEQRLPLPNRQQGELMAVVEQHMGGGRLRVICEDGKTRLARIPGKIKKRKWIKVGDLLIVKPWDFQDEKADVIYRYTPTQVANLARRNLIPDSISVFI